MRFFFSSLLIFALAACATNTGALSIGPDTYLISVERAPILGGRSAARTVALTDAGRFCAEQGKQLMVLSTGAFHSGPMRDTGLDVQFRCLREGDPGLSRPTLEPAPSSVIEFRTR